MALDFAKLRLGQSPMALHDHVINNMMQCKRRNDQWHGRGAALFHDDLVSTRSIDALLLSKMTSFPARPRLERRTG
jgi:hypothetical protein